MAGGRGTRFWPRSRRARAKQVLRVLGERSLIQQTWDRLRPLLPSERFWVITNAALRDEIVRQLPEAPPGQIIAEPAARNTAPCIGLAARILLAQDPDAVMGVFPADHVITRPAVFRRLVRQAYRAALRDQLVVLGIRPRGPETGYGYIEFAGARVRRFHEKPDAATARRYVRSGQFYWNSGMFVWKAAVIDAALRRYLPRAAGALDRIPDRPGGVKFDTSLRTAYPRCDDISIDYAVMEKADNVAGIRCPEFGWNDVGSWNAVYQLLPHDRHGNVGRTQALFHRSAGNYVDAPGKFVALVGVDDVMVVETDDALLVGRRDRAQEVSEVVQALQKQGLEDLL